MAAESPSQANGAATVSLYELIENEATAPVAFKGGQVVRVDYRPDRMTPARMRKLQDEAETEGGDQATLLLAIATGWDLAGPLRDADGRELVPAGAPIPFDAEHVAHVPGPILTRLLVGVGEHANPEAVAPGGPSRGRSFTRGR